MLFEYHHENPQQLKQPTHDPELFTQLYTVSKLILCIVLKYPNLWIFLLNVIVFQT